MINTSSLDRKKYWNIKASYYNSAQSVTHIHRDFLQLNSNKSNHLAVVKHNFKIRIWYYIWNSQLTIKLSSTKSIFFNYHHFLKQEMRKIKSLLFQPKNETFVNIDHLQTYTRDIHK